MINEHCLNFHPTSSGFTSRVYPCQSYKPPLMLYLFPEVLLNALPNLYFSPWLGNIFKSVVLRLLGNVSESTS